MTYFKSILTAILVLGASASIAQEGTSNDVQSQARSSSSGIESFRYFRPRPQEYEVTITNLTYNQVFAPSLVVSHRRNISLFEVGETASDGIAIMAEDGDVSAIVASVDGDSRVRGAGVTDGPLMPGKSTTISIPINGGSRVSLVSMLVNTNDAFYAVNTVTVPRNGGTRTIYAPAFDAGTEVNDELCGNIPGPACGGEGFSSVDGEGFIHIHRGMHGIGDLAASEYDWRNPVAKVTIRRK